MKQPIIYKLYLGAHQPYERCLELGLNFYGGEAVKGDEYLGILECDEAKVEV